MPTYEYECQGCGNKFELFQSIMADNTTTCAKCNASAKRLIGSGAGIIFKGSGFYETDYSAHGVFIRDQHAFVAYGKPASLDSGFVILDVSDVTNPKFVGQYNRLGGPPFGPVFRIFVQDDYVYITYE